MADSDNSSRGKRNNFYRGRGRGRGGFKQGGYRGGYHDKPFHKRPPMNHYHSQKRTKFEVTNRLKEVDIGVTEFVGTHEHINGIVKERFNDFHVHEINLDGELSQLTNQDIPAPPEDALDLNELKKNLPQETFDQIKSLSKADANVNSVEIDVTDMDKEQRKMLHFIGKKIPSIVSQTIEKDQKKLLVLAKNDKTYIGNKFYRDSRPEWNYPSNYCHFVLHKVNMDTMDALNLLGMHLRLKPNSFTYAGTKDRRARTTQWICLKQIHPSSILDAGKRVRGAFVGNFKFAKDPLRLGQLKGNHFTIALRNVTATDEEIETALTSLRDNGFINYYGLQRFGTVASVPTHDIGKALLQANWSTAIDLILQPRSGELLNMAEAREIYAKTKDAKAALDKIQRQDKIEAKLLRGIVSCGKNNPQGALDALPRNARTMYIHAYQSFVWNHLVSRRIKELGNKPIVGDLVYEKRDTSDTVPGEAPEAVEDSVEQAEEAQEKDKEEETDGQQVLASAEDAAEGTGAEEAGQKAKEETMEVVEAQGKEKEEKEEKKTGDEVIERDFYPLPAVKMLTEEDLGSYTLADVVMPQPGWRVTYPSYAKEWYEEFLAKDGLTTDLRQKNQKYSLGGQYRKILQVPKDMSWRIVHYNDLQADLILADIDKMRNHELPKDVPDGKYKALILEITLSSSTYATMALREILKHDTSAETQAAQSAAHHAQDKKDRKLEAEEKEKLNGDGGVKPPSGEEKDDGVESVADEANNEKMEITEETVAEPAGTKDGPDEN
ncbi:pseudouridylate synthase 7 homolog isoform X2 [Diachasma alloeum]|uniref:pseudouridylate synthase 7 homolog isoform X2 n=1 Tax=Diachasma alloeum TaxID=454923 RepID=UPI0007385128|nr:pseudouridylate synthase 7 homolog isoform X2 [Diachasma alloeum]